MVLCRLLPDANCHIWPTYAPGNGKGPDGRYHGWPMEALRKCEVCVDAIMVDGSFGERMRFAHAWPIVARRITRNEIWVS